MSLCQHFLTIILTNNYQNLVRHILIFPRINSVARHQGKVKFYFLHSKYECYENFCIIDINQPLYTDVNGRASSKCITIFRTRKVVNTFSILNEMRIRKLPTHVGTADDKRKIDFPKYKQFLRYTSGVLISFIVFCDCTTEKSHTSF